MGTNFYLKRKLRKEEKKDIKRYIDEDRIDTALGILKSLTEEVHLCKRSAGWQVCFDHNWGKYYEPSRKAIENYININEGIIADEYGDEYTPQEFWKMVDEWNSNPNNAWVSKTYEEYEKSKDTNFRTYNDYFGRDKCKNVFGIECDSDDFSIDGLRFAVYSDFS